MPGERDVKEIRVYKWKLIASRPIGHPKEGGRIM
jgi:hypothetical protein